MVVYVCDVLCCVGKEAVFEVNVLGVKTKTLLPWNDELAGKIREGMTLAELDQEARHANLPYPTLSSIPSRAMSSTLVVYIYPAAAIHTHSTLIYIH